VRKKISFPGTRPAQFFILFYLFLKKTARDGRKRNVLLISKLALEGDLVIARNVFDLPRNNSKHDDRVSVTCFYAYNERGKKGHTVQIPAFLSSLTDSGSPSTAASFSYANSSAIFEDTAPSAMSTHRQYRYNE